MRPDGPVQYPLNVHDISQEKNVGKNRPIIRQAASAIVDDSKSPRDNIEIMEWERLTQHVCGVGTLCVCLRNTKHAV